MTYANGSKFSGNWQRGRRHGKGVFTTPDETTKYVGDWVNDLREGKGILTDATGVYNGDWANDMVIAFPSCCEVFLAHQSLSLSFPAQRTGNIYAHKRHDLYRRVEGRQEARGGHA